MEFVKTPYIADALGLDASSVSHYCATGLLPAVQKAKSHPYLIQRGDADVFIARYKAGLIRGISQRKREIRRSGTIAMKKLGGRPKRKRLSIAIREDVLARAKRLADASGYALNDLIEDAVIQALTALGEEDN